MKFYTDTKLKKDQLHNVIYKLKLFPKDLNRLRSDIHVAIQIEFLVKWHYYLDPEENNTDADNENGPGDSDTESDDEQSDSDNDDDDDDEDDDEDDDAWCLIQIKDHEYFLLKAKRFKILLWLIKKFIVFCFTLTKVYY